MTIEAPTPETGATSSRHAVIRRGLRLGYVFLRGRRWWIEHRWAGHEVRRPAEKILKRPVESRQDAEEALLMATRVACAVTSGLKRTPLATTAAPDVPPVLRGLLGAPDFDLLGADVMRQRCPIVYAWVRGRRVLYVGRSRLGLSRFLSEHHHAVVDLRPDDRIFAWVFTAPDEADRAEAILIAEARPERNIRQ